MSLLSLFGMSDHSEWAKVCPICKAKEVMPINAGQAKCHSCKTVFKKYSDIN